MSGTTVFASDTIAFSGPTTAATNFAVNLSAANFPNISSYAMTGTTGYSLRLWGPSSGYGIQRTTGYANGTTNNFYTVSDGFVALDTFRNNVANYTNTTNSYPTLSIAFGQPVAVLAAGDDLRRQWKRHLRLARPPRHRGRRLRPGSRALRVDHR